MRFNKTLWAVQGLVAALFLMAGSTKLLGSVDALAAMFHLPEELCRVVGVLEVTGALGLLLPGIFRIRQGLTPLAAAGLSILMAGATTLSVVYLGAGSAVLPFVLVIVLGSICYGRSGGVVPPVAARTTATAPALVRNFAERLG